MKKVLYVIAVAAATIFAAGCAREQAASVAAGQDASTVTFTVSAPGIATKAISDGTSATQLTFAVYDDAGNYLKELSENAATVTGANPTWTVTVPVVQQLTYQFVFIAKAATSPYAVDLANKKVTATYGAANDDAADFFYAALKETVGSDLNKSVELVRPLAQVNVGAADLVAAAYSLNVENMTTGLKLTGINNVLNILDGTVSGSADITLAEATRVKEDTKFVAGFDRIAMGYVLVGEKQTTNATINITAKGKIDGADKVVVRDVPNVPIQANYRTNILGNIFTSNMTFNVEVKPGFDTPEINETLETNIEKANTLFAAGETSVTVDLAPAEGGETTVTLPATTDNVRLNLNITTDKTITVQYADGAKPANVEIYAKDVEALVADLASSTVTITAGSKIKTGTFATAPSTLIIEETAQVTNLIIKAGNVEIGKDAVVTSISRDASNTDAITYVNMASGAVWTNISTEKSAVLVPMGYLAEGFRLDADGKYYIENAAGLKGFRNIANAGTTFSGATIVLEDNVNLANEAWTPAYLSGDATKFAGVFDGNGKTISNLKVDLTATPAYQAAGLFGASAGTIKNLTIDGASVKNLTTGSATVNGTAVVVGSMAYGGTIENITVKNATVEANRYCGGIVGYVSGTVKDCVVDQISIVCTPDNLTGSYDNGDKCGGIYGYLNPHTTNSITGNSVTNFSIKGYRDLGGIGGTALAAGTISGNTATNGTITIDQKTNSYGTKDANAHEIVGRSNATPTISDNTFENVEVVEFIADGVYSKDGIIHVSKPASLATAVSEAPDGATIALADGNYNSGANLEIKKNLTIKAENDKQAQIDGKIIITNNKTIRLENLLLQNDNLAPATTNQYYERTTTAIVGSYDGSIEVDNCLIKAMTNVAALYLYAANSVEDHLYVTNSVFDGSLAFANDPAEGFRPMMCQGSLKIENCTFIKLDRYVCQMYGKGSDYTSTITIIGNKIDNPTSPDDYSVANILSVGSGATLDNVVIDVHGNTDLDGNVKQFTYACKYLTLIGSNITYATGCDAIEWKLQSELKGN